jgi:hypothetical protein
LKTAEDILQQSKFGVKDKSGKIFKYMSYGNTHHVEIIRNVKTGKIKGAFVTMLEASHRVKGINNILYGDLSNHFVCLLNNQLFVFEVQITWF